MTTNITAGYPMDYCHICEVPLTEKIRHHENHAVCNRCFTKVCQLHGDSDPVNHPAHYTDNPKGIQLIDMIGHLSFPKGAAIKYIYRAGVKDPSKTVEDLRKARWFIDHLIDEALNQEFLLEK
jgi:hypothetical protein